MAEFDAENTINILTVTDNRYYMNLAVMLRSVVLHNDKERKIRVYVLHETLDEENKEKLSCLVQHESIEIVFKRISRDFLKSKGIGESFEKTAIYYVRIMAPYVVPRETKRILYLDNDLILMEDISMLWEAELGDKTIAAAQDEIVRYVSFPGGGIRNYESFGLHPKAKYFNSGVMLIDLQKWRNQSISEKAIRCMNENSKHISLWDQYALNVVLAGKWKELDPRWNQFPGNKSRNPFILHFILSCNIPTYLTWTKKLVPKIMKSDRPVPEISLH